MQATLRAALDDLLACPCGGALAPTGDDAVACASCGRAFRVIDDVLDVLGAADPQACDAPAQPHAADSGKNAP